MAYTPTNWTTGDTINATAMNKIENGIANAGSALIVQQSYINGRWTLNKTVQELYEATEAGIPVYLVYQYGNWQYPSSFTSENTLCRMIAIYRYGNMVCRVSFVRMAGTHSLGGYDYLPIIGLAHYGAELVTDYPYFIQTESI